MHPILTLWICGVRGIVVHRRHHNKLLHSSTQSQHEILLKIKTAEIKPIHMLICCIYCSECFFKQIKIVNPHLYTWLHSSLLISLLFGCSSQTCGVWGNTQLTAACVCVCKRFLMQRPSARPTGHWADLLMLLMVVGTQRSSVQLLSLSLSHKHPQLCSGCSFGQLLSYIGQIISVHACYVGKP